MKVVSKILLVIIIIVSFICYRVHKLNEDKILLSRLTDTCKSVALAYSSGEGLESLPKELVADSVITDIEEYITNLKARNDAALDVDKLFLNYYEDSEYGVVKEKGSTEVLRSNEKPDDTRIFSNNGVASVCLKDLDPSNNGFDSLNYKGVLIKFDMVEEYLTYDKLMLNPSYNYTFSSIGKLKDYNNSTIDVIMNSIDGLNWLKLRCTIVNKKIVDIKVI